MNLLDKYLGKYLGDLDYETPASQILVLAKEVELLQAMALKSKSKHHQRLYRAARKRLKAALAPAANSK